MSKDHDLLRSRIESEAWRLTVQRGIRGWNTLDLATAVGISKRTLYKVVPSKEAILVEIVLAKIYHTQQRLAALVEDGSNVSEQLERLTVEFPRLLVELNPSVFREIYRVHPIVEEQAAAQHRALGAPLIAFFRRHQAAGVLRPSPEPETVFQMLQALVLHFLREEEDSSVAVRKIRESMRIVFYGLLSEKRSKT